MNIFSSFVVIIVISYINGNW